MNPLPSSYLPPGEGWWLSGLRLGRTPGQGPFAYHRSVSMREAEELMSAADALSNQIGRPEVAAVIDQYGVWKSALSEVARAKAVLGGPLLAETVVKALDHLLPMWSSAMEMMAGGPASSFASRVLKQMRNLRMHEGAVPLVLDFSISYGVCEGCGDRHVANGQLGVGVEISSLLSGKCPARLRSELRGMRAASVDLVATVEAAVNEFEELLLAETLDAGLSPQALEKIVNAWDETSPLSPVLTRLDRPNPTSSGTGGPIWDRMGCTPSRGSTPV